MKAIIPCAGLGTRMLPTSDYIPKELLPIWDKPAVYYTIQEAINAGLNPVVVVSPVKLEMFKKALKSLNYCVDYVIQDKPNGLGDSIRCGLGDEENNVAVLLPDEFIPEGINMLLKTNCNLLVQKIPENKRCEYGMIGIEQSGNVLSIHEKPKGKCQYNLGIIGRYVLDSFVLNELRKGETLDYALTLACSLNRIKAIERFGIRFDTGCRDGWLKANMHAAKTLGVIKQDFVMSF